MGSIDILVLLASDRLQGILPVLGLIRLEDGEALAPGADLEEVLMLPVLRRLRHWNNHIARTSIVVTLDLHDAGEAARRHKFRHTVVIKLLRHVFLRYHLYSCATTRRGVDALGVADASAEVRILPCLRRLLLKNLAVIIVFSAEYNRRYSILLLLFLEVLRGLLKFLQAINLGLNYLRTFFFIVFLLSQEDAFLLYLQRYNGDRTGILLGQWSRY